MDGMENQIQDPALAALLEAKEKEEKFFRDLHRPGISWPDACKLVDQVFSKPNLVRDPYNPTKLVTLKRTGPANTTHALFKNPLGEQLKRLRQDDHYRQSNGERGLWIPETLRNPHGIYMQGPPHNCSLLYVVKPFPHERFAVIAGDNGGAIFFKTMYHMDLSDTESEYGLASWNKLLKGSRQLYRR